MIPCRTSSLFLSPLLSHGNWGGGNEDGFNRVLHQSESADRTVSSLRPVCWDLHFPLRQGAVITIWAAKSVLDAPPLCVLYRPFCPSGCLFTWFREIPDLIAGVCGLYGERERRSRRRGGSVSRPPDACFRAQRKVLSTESQHYPVRDLTLIWVFAFRGLL